MANYSENESNLIRYYENRDPQTLSITEFGHNIYPICLTASALTSAYKRYTGIETWYRGGDTAKKRLDEKLAAAGIDSTVYSSMRFITHDSGVAIHHSGDERWQEGSYTPYVTSEADSEDEVVASNLFGDPDVADSASITQAVLAQMSEITHPDGLIVLRETITPERVRHVYNETFLGKVGLRNYLTYQAINSPLWKTLESLYDGGKAQPQSSESRYIFLKKNPSVKGVRTDPPRSPN